MGVDEVATFDARLSHVKRGERRVAEMESRVQCLREKLCRLEKMLPENEEIERLKVGLCDDFIEGDICPIDAIVKKEKLLRKQIYDMECTEQAYMRKLADMNVENPAGQTASCSPGRKNRDAIAKERLNLLESYSQKLSNNLESLEKNHVGLTQEAQNLSQVLNRTRQDCFKKSPRSPPKSCAPCDVQKPKKLEECVCKLLVPKCNSCIVCSCDEWELELECMNESETQKDRVKPKPIQHSSPRNKRRTTLGVDCACNATPKHNSGDDYSCNDWERDLRNCRNGIKQKKGASKSKSHTCRSPTPKTCSCYESSSSDTDESMCECQRKKPAGSCVKPCDCTTAESETSDCSSEDKTRNSDKSKLTCCCSQSHSHEDLVVASNSYVCNGKTFVKDTKIKRFRGGLDTINTTTTVMSLEKSFTPPTSNIPSIQNSVASHLKLVKVEELRESLERLKLRNRNLKDFLYTLESPLAIPGPQPSEAAASVCTEVSSCMTLDLAQQTHSGLLTVVKVLESKCRSKDAIIVALADELKTGNNKRLRISEKELETEKVKLLKNYHNDKKDSGIKFTKKDSAIGFLVFIMILISHVKRSEMISYFCAMKKILTKSPFQLIHFIHESDYNLSSNWLPVIYKRMSRLTKNLIVETHNRYEELGVWLNQFFLLSCEQIYSYAISAMTYQSENENYIAIALSLMFVTVLFILRYKRCATTSVIRMYDKFLNVSNTANSSWITLLRILQNHILSSRIFWIILGYCCHILWTLIEADLFKLLDSMTTYYHNSTTDTKLILKKSEEVKETIFDLSIAVFYLHYSWFITIFNAKLQDFLDISYNILKTIIV